MSTDLHKRMLAFDHGDSERNNLMREVWQGHPWMVDAYTGNYDGGRKQEILHWCYETFGQQASPIHKRPGGWYQGGATIYGWTWMGFTSESDMQKFIARWPAPSNEKETAA